MSGTAIQPMFKNASNRALRSPEHTSAVHDMATGLNVTTRSMSKAQANAMPPSSIVGTTPTAAATKDEKAKRLQLKEKMRNALSIMTTGSIKSYGSSVRKQKNKNRRARRLNRSRRSVARGRREARRRRNKMGSSAPSGGDDSDESGTDSGKDYGPATPPPCEHSWTGLFKDPSKNPRRCRGCPFGHLMQFLVCKWCGFARCLVRWHVQPAPGHMVRCRELRTPTSGTSSEGGWPL